MSAPSFRPVARSVVETVRDHDVTFLAAGISYYVLVSLVPLFTLAVVVATAVGGADFAARVQSIAGAYLLPTGSDLVADALENRAGQGALSAVSLTVTLWGALKLFRGVDVAFARIYGYPVSPILRQLSDGIVALATLGAAVVGVAVATAVVAVVDVPFVGVVGPLLLVFFLVLAFLPLYAVIPDVSVPLRGALPGAVLAAVGWAGLSAGFGVYTRSVTGVAGALGGVLLLVTWFYVSGILVLTGAALNAVLAGDWTVLDPSWNVLNWYYDVRWFDSARHGAVPSRRDRPRMLREAKVIHYTTRFKPWRAECDHPRRRRYFHYLRRSGWMPPAAYARWRLGLEVDQLRYRLGRALRARRFPVLADRVAGPVGA